MSTYRAARKKLAKNSATEKTRNGRYSAKWEARKDSGKEKKCPFRPGTLLPLDLLSGLGQTVHGMEVISNVIGRQPIPTQKKIGMKDTDKYDQYRKVDSVAQAHLY